LKNGKSSSIYWLTYNEFNLGDKMVWASGVPTFVLLNNKGTVLNRYLDYPEYSTFRKAIKKAQKNNSSNTEKR
jgi:hypothetical protein